MKFLALFIGLSCCITGVFLKKQDNKKMQSRFCIIAGALLILVWLIFRWFGLTPGFFTITIVMAGVLGGLKLNDFPPISEKLTVRQNYVLKWCIFTVIMLSPVLFGIYAARLPNVTLDNGVIKMGGSFGGDFSIAEIQLVDTVHFYPKVGIMRGGSGFWVSYIGNFDVEGEQKTSKLCIYRYKPPFIKIRMKDERLFLLNFYSKDATIEFYNQLRNAVFNEKNEFEVKSLNINDDKKNDKKQIFKYVDTSPMVIGLLFIVIGILIGVFKQTWLIAGVNTMSKKELAKMDLDYVGKWFGIFSGVFGGIFILSQFIFKYLNIMNYYHYFILISIFVFCVFLILYFNVIKKDRIYKKTEK